MLPKDDGVRGLSFAVWEVSKCLMRMFDICGRKGADDHPKMKLFCGYTLVTHPMPPQLSAFGQRGEGREDVSARWCSALNVEMMRYVSDSFS